MCVMAQFSKVHALTVFFMVITELIDPVEESMENFK